jgi:glyoxalase family protein
MPASVGGIHHVTALAADPQGNIDFYTGVLGLRLVKKTVNFDAPDVYHLYYGNDTGEPGTILTFFPFPDAARGKKGSGEISAVAFAAPAASAGYWADHLSRHGVHFEGPASRFGGEYIAFEDPEGMGIEIVFAGGGLARDQEWSPVPRESAIVRIAGVTLVLRESARTADVLTLTLGARVVGREGVRERYLVGEGGSSAAVDLVESPGLPRGTQSAGSVHHIAWRTPTAEDQLEWRMKAGGAGIPVTEVLDRKYFRSIYFREPGGVLFEIATDPPGFTVDEAAADLGKSLKLPAWLEPDREKLERLLPPVHLPQ